MKTVLITGGTGILGSKIAARLSEYSVQRLSRKASGLPGVVVGNLLEPSTLNLSGVEVVIHAASNPLNPPEDIIAAQNLVAAARQAGVKHLIFVSIVGIDKADLPYYKAKLEVERIIVQSGIPFTHVRATQFHDFAVFILSQMVRGPIMVVPRGAVLQSVDIDAVADYLAKTVEAAPTNGIQNIAGPEILPVIQMAREWLEATHQRKWILSLPLPIPIARALSQGHLVLPEAQKVGRSWQQWLSGQAQNRNPYLKRQLQ